MKDLAKKCNYCSEIVVIINSVSNTVVAMTRNDRSWSVQLDIKL